MHTDLGIPAADDRLDAKGWMRADPPWANAFTMSTVAIVVSPEKVVNVGEDAIDIHEDRFDLGGALAHPGSDNREHG